MSINFEKKTMNDVVTHLIPKTTKFVEDNYFELSSAGKYQVAILTAVCFIKMLEDLSNNINFRKILDDRIFEEEFLNVFDFYKKQYLQNNKYIPKYNLKFIDTYNEFGNETMLKMNQTIVKVDVFKLLFLETYKEIARMEKGNNSMFIYINIFFNPFFLLPTDDIEKKQTYDVITFEVIKNLNYKNKKPFMFCDEFMEFTTQEIINILN